MSSLSLLPPLTALATETGSDVIFMRPAHFRLGERVNSWQDGGVSVEVTGRGRGGGTGSGTLFVAVGPLLQSVVGYGGEEAAP